MADSVGIETMERVLREMGEKAVAASRALAVLPPEEKNRCLCRMAERIESSAASIKAANGQDLAAARASGLSEAMIDRLALNDRRIAEMAEGLRVVASQVDPVGRILHTSSVLGGNLLIPIGKSAAAGRIRLHKLLYKAVLEEQAANLELEVVPFRQTADGEAATSPLVRSLTQIVGRSRVYQLALTGDLRPEAAQQHVPALNLSGSAHQREPLPAYAHILQASAADLPPIEIFPEIQSLPASGGLPIFNGPLELLDGPKRLSSAAKDPRRYYRARSATGELLWIFQDLQNRRWFLQGRFA